VSGQTTAVGVVTADANGVLAVAVPAGTDDWLIVLERQP
jgi:hypothetical protein